MHKAMSEEKWLWSHLCIVLQIGAISIKMCQSCFNGYSLPSPPFQPLSFYPTKRLFLLMGQFCYKLLPCREHGQNSSAPP